MARIVILEVERDDNDAHSPANDGWPEALAEVEKSREFRQTMEERLGREPELPIDTALRQIMQPVWAALAGDRRAAADALVLLERLDQRVRERAKASLAEPSQN